MSKLIRILFVRKPYAQINISKQSKLFTELVLARQNLAIFAAHVLGEKGTYNEIMTFQ